MRGVLNRFVAVAFCTASVGALASCGSKGADSGGTVTVTVSKSPPAAAPPTSSAASTTAASTPPPQHLSRLRGSCDTQLPDYLVTQTLGGKQLAGPDAFVVGQPEKDIARIGYLNCRYGITGKGASAVAKVEIGVSLYATAAKAAARITATVDDYTTHGATSTDTTVAGLPAMLLTGGTGTGYDIPLLIVASGQRTAAVSVVSSVAAGAQLSKASTDLAALALRRTAG